MQAGSGLAEVFGILAAEDRDGDGVDKHEGWRIEDLVRSAAESYAESGLRGLGLQHKDSGMAAKSVQSATADACTVSL
jgi:hypothetical protein